MPRGPRPPRALVSAAAAAPWLDPALPASVRVDALVKAATAQEKAGYLNTKNLHGIRRLGVPALPFGEALHGVMARTKSSTRACGDAHPPSTGCATSFPCALGLAASFNESLFAAVATAIADEARALHLQRQSFGPGSQRLSGLVLWTPDINLFRDPRWGRGQEVPGECPWLTSRYAVVFIRALQRVTNEGRYHTMATPKHFSAYGLENWHGRSRHSLNVRVRMRDYAEYYLPAWYAAVAPPSRGGAGAGSVMCAYNAVNGTPSCANGHLNTKLLRDEFGFDGFIVSDCHALCDLEPFCDAPTRANPNYKHVGHGYVRTEALAARAALTDGACDANCGVVFPRVLNAAVVNGSVGMPALDAAARRLFHAALRLGLLDGHAHTRAGTDTMNLLDGHAHTRAGTDTMNLLDGHAHTRAGSDTMNLLDGHEHARAGTDTMNLLDGHAHTRAGTDTMNLLDGHAHTRAGTDTMNLLDGHAHTRAGTDTMNLLDGHAHTRAGTDTMNLLDGHAHARAGTDTMNLLDGHAHTRAGTKPNPMIVGLETVDRKGHSELRHAHTHAGTDPTPSVGVETVDSEGHRELARAAARQALVLLKNEHATLPLRIALPHRQDRDGGRAMGKPHTMAVIGPHANASQALLSNYHGPNLLVNSHSPLMALRARAASVGRGALAVRYAAGCGISTEDRVGLEEAVAAARGAESVLLFLGLDQTLEAEGKDRWSRRQPSLSGDSTSLPHVQEELLKAVAAECERSNKRLVLVLINGGTLSVESAAASPGVGAIVEAFYPGELGGEAIADVLLPRLTSIDTGSVVSEGYSPSGKLPVTVYPADFVKRRSMSDMSMRSVEGITYRYYTGRPLYPFGFGLTYTSFSYAWASTSSLSVSRRLRTSGEMPAFEVRVRNTGAVAGEAVLLAFASSDHQGAPRTKLVAFARSPLLEPGGTAVLTLSTQPTSLALADDAGVFAVRAGRYKIRCCEVERKPTVRGGFAVGPLVAKVELVGPNSVVYTVPRLRSGPLSYSSPRRTHQRSARKTVGQAGRA